MDATINPPCDTHCNCNGRAVCVKRFLHSSTLRSQPDQSPNTRYYGWDDVFAALAGLCWAFEAVVRWDGVCVAHHQYVLC